MPKLASARELAPERRPPWGHGPGEGPPVGRLTSRWTHVDGIPIHARASLDPAPGRPVVLVHGMGVASGYLEPTARLLALDHPVHVPDLPGYGDSGDPGRILTLPELADALDHWMDAVGLDRAALLGNSFGCEIIVELALRHPERVERAILQGPTPDPHHRGALQQILRWRENKKREDDMTWVPSMGPIANRDYVHAGFLRMVRTFHMMLRDRIEDKLPRVHAPTLVVGGTIDTITPPAWVKEAAELLPHGRHEILDGAPHTANYFCPMALADVVETFLRENP